MTRVGIGIGGTFIDLVTIGPEGISLIKLPSVPHAPHADTFNVLLASRTRSGRFRQSASAHDGGPLPTAHREPLNLLSGFY